MSIWTRNIKKFENFENRKKKYYQDSKTEAVEILGVDMKYQLSEKFQAEHH